METIIKSNYANVEEVNVTKFVNEIKADTNNNYIHHIEVIGDQYGKVLQALQAYGAKVVRDYTSNKEPQMPQGVTPAHWVSIEGYQIGGEIHLKVSGSYSTFFAYKNKIYRWNDDYGVIHLHNNTEDKMNRTQHDTFAHILKGIEQPNKMHKINLRAIQRWADYLDKREQAAKELVQQYKDNEARLLDELDKAGIRYKRTDYHTFVLYCGIHCQKVYISGKGVTFFPPEVNWSEYRKAVDNLGGEFADLALLTKLAAI